MPSQKDIIHLTFGTLSHHITTHFFNQQASHFEYPEQGIAGPSRTRDDDDDDSDKEEDPLLFDPAVDFQEGIGTRRSEPTFFPRQLVVDFKHNLGTAWDAYNVVVDDDAEDEDEGDQDGYSVLRPSKAANEGYHAWNNAAEVQWVGGTDGKVKSTRLGPVLDADGDEYYEDSDEEEHANTATNGSAEQLHDTAKRQFRKPKRTNLTPASYAHNPHHPRSTRSLPYHFGGGSLVPMDVQKEEGKVPFTTFEMGIGLFRQMDKEESLLDEQLRWFAEDSDSLQSFSLSASTFDGFGGMAHEMVQLLSDEFPKIPVLAWGADQEIDTDVQDGLHKDRLARLRKANNALSLWSLSSASLYTPMGLPQELSSNTAPSQYLSSRNDWRDPYHLSGLFAAHIDTATLSSRLHNERSRQTTATLINSLNWRRDTPIGQLGGCIPTPLLAPYAVVDRPLDPIEALLAARGYDPRKQDRKNSNRMTDTERAKIAAEAIQKSYISFAPGQNAHDGKDKPYAQFTTARDDRMAETPTKAALEAWSALDEPAGGSCFVPAAFNVRWSSFPQMFRGLTSNGRPLPPTHKDTNESEEQKKRRTKVQSVPMLASLSTTPESAHLIADARQFIDSTLIKGHEPLTAYGIGGSRGRSGAGQAASEETEGFLGGRDGLMEVRERLEELLGAYEEGLAGGRIMSTEEEDAIGTDEEYEDDHEEEWDL
ncbi:uncharacterized protein FA14DRAFT_161364 [Meira miltonrushii]|uniref:Tubulin nucleotide-binding domain-like protein n=1 Tax=Meira miltonrushii TaxID=1280837 RepID=A0A316V7J3_9BASI|nr:uncharacterized protein FA14DRAFT_161364 [Meira miltonrushii]PWN33589.1 hypothetical protein FA14DRAFT_161364 [Meira miltonrushii]